MEPSVDLLDSTELLGEKPQAEKSKEHAVDADDEEVIDVYAELAAGNPFPLIAGIEHVDLDHMLDENTPVLHKLCGLCLPLDELLKGKKIEFTPNK
jgi:hypothetical protein